MTTADSTTVSSRHAHDHVFGQDQRRAGERRTQWVIALTLITMVVEIGAGISFGSMALLADGLHMASHAVALTINAFAYWYARRHAANPTFSFGTGKVNALGGYTGALLLAAFGATMAWESVSRLVAPVPIAFDYAIAVAVVGLVVNGASVLILDHDHDHDHDHHHGHGHHHDHNLRSAYLHVLADALTSVLAIVALLAGKYAGLDWMDPAMGIVGAVLVTRWALGLIRDSSHTLLDKQAPDHLRDRLRSHLEAPGDTVVDLHLWFIGPGLLATEIVLVSENNIEIDVVESRLPGDIGLVHSTIEVRRPD